MIQPLIKRGLGNPDASADANDFETIGVAKLIRCFTADVQEFHDFHHGIAPLSNGWNSVDF